MTQQTDKQVTVTRETFELIVKKLGTVYNTEEAIDSIWKDCQLYAEKLKDRKTSLPSDELWDKYSERIDEDIDSLNFFAGRDVITKEKYKKLMSEIKSQMGEIKLEQVSLPMDIENELEKLVNSKIVSNYILIGDFWDIIKWLRTQIKPIVAQKRIEECLDEVAKKYKFNDWRHLFRKRVGMNYSLIESDYNEAIQLYYEQRKREEIKPINIVFKSEKEVDDIFTTNKAVTQFYNGQSSGYKQAQEDIKKQLK